jgi:hypothetical protein
MPATFQAAIRHDVRLYVLEGSESSDQCDAARKSIKLI